MKAHNKNTWLCCYVASMLHLNLEDAFRLTPSSFLKTFENNVRHIKRVASKKKKEKWSLIPRPRPLKKPLAPQALMQKKHAALTQSAAVYAAVVEMNAAAARCKSSFFVRSTAVPERRPMRKRMLIDLCGMYVFLSFLHIMVHFHWTIKISTERKISFLICRRLASLMCILEHLTNTFILHKGRTNQITQSKSFLWRQCRSYTLSFFLQFSHKKGCLYTQAILSCRRVNLFHLFRSRFIWNDHFIRISTNIIRDNEVINQNKPCFLSKRYW